MVKVVGIPKETKKGERRIALVPEDCRRLSDSGIRVHLESGAGDLSGFPDREFENAGCILKKNAKSLYEESTLIVKVKEPQPPEITLLGPEHTLFCYLHLGGNPGMAEELRQTGVTAYAFETVREGDYTPLLAPMSQIAGHLSVLMSSNFIMTPWGGRGSLLGQNPFHSPGKILIMGLGMAGKSAVEIAWKMGMEVYVSDISPEKREQALKNYPGIRIAPGDRKNLIELLPDIDVLVGAVYVVGKRAPLIIDREMIRHMPKGAVAFDISIDQGGCIETSRPCTHDDPVYIEEGIVHSAITNLPSAVSRTASISLSGAIWKYVIDLAKGINSNGLETGLNIHNKKFNINF